MKDKNKKCSVSNCTKEVFCKGFCTKHYQQMHFKGTIKQKDFVFINGICKIIGCGKKLFAKGYCQIHYLENKGD